MCLTDAYKNIAKFVTIITYTQIRLKNSYFFAFLFSPEIFIANHIFVIWLSISLSKDISFQVICLPNIDPSCLVIWFSYQCNLNFPSIAQALKPPKYPITKKCFLNGSSCNKSCTSADDLQSYLFICSYTFLPHHSAMPQPAFLPIEPILHKS